MAWLAARTLRHPSLVAANGPSNLAALLPTAPGGAPTRRG